MSGQNGRGRGRARGRGRGDLASDVGQQQTAPGAGRGQAGGGAWQQPGDGAPGIGRASQPNPWGQQQQPQQQQQQQQQQLVSSGASASGTAWNQPQQQRPPEVQPSRDDGAALGATGGGGHTSGGIRGGYRGRASGRGTGRNGGGRGDASEAPEEQMQRLTVRERGRRRGGIDEFRPIEVRPCNVQPREKTKVPDKCVQERILVNHVAVIADELIYCQYQVDFSPQLEQRSWRKQLIDQLMNELNMQHRYFFNGFSVLYTRSRLPEERIEKAFNHPRKADGSAAEVETVKVTLRFTNELPPTSPEIIHLCNVMIRSLQKKMGMVLFGRTHVFMDQHDEIRQYGIDIVRGFDPAVLRFESGLHLEVDVLYRVICTRTVLERMQDLYARSREVTEWQQKILNEFLGSVVMTRYNNKTYRIDDVDFEANPQSSFRKQDGSEITYARYFQQQYNISGLDPNQFMLVSRPSKRDLRRGDRHNIYLPPQLCFMTGISDAMKRDFKIMQSVGNITRADPENRIRLVMDFLRNKLGTQENREALAQFGIQLGSNLLHANSYRITETTIGVGGREFLCNEVTADFSNELRNIKLDQAVAMDTILVVYSDREQTVMGFLGLLQKVLNSYNVQVRFNYVKTDGYQVTHFIRCLKANIAANPRPSCVIVILPKNDKVLYDAVKLECGVHSPIPSQCIVMKTIERDRGLMSVATKIGLQMQSKLGALLWHVKTPNLPPICIIGIDVYHDSVHKGKSVAAMVGSMNPHMTAYYSRSVHQDRGQEIIDSAGVMFTEILKKYRELNGKPPSLVFVYRDGVGDGQLAAVHEHEVTQFNNIFDKLFPDGGNFVRPKLCYIIVKKRINQRFFREFQDDRGTKRVGNPLPGTVIDQDVTRLEWFDFFIVSQSVRQGTVSPTHYNVIHDDMRWPAERVHKLTYWLTHLYYNWPGTIRVPAPCQYAHKLAFIIGQSIHQDVHSSLFNKLWFL